MFPVQIFLCSYPAGKKEQKQQQLRRVQHIHSDLKERFRSAFTQNTILSSPCSLFFTVAEAGDWCAHLQAGFFPVASLPLTVHRKRSKTHETVQRKHEKAVRCTAFSPSSWLIAHFVTSPSNRYVCVQRIRQVTLFKFVLLLLLLHLVLVVLSDLVTWSPGFLLSLSGLHHVLDSRIMGFDWCLRDSRIFHHCGIRK